jgi:hypothetical protein
MDSIKSLARSIVATSVASIFLFAYPCLSEELEPRRWSHLPIDTNYFGAGYAYTEADIGFDPVLTLENVEMELEGP